MNKRGKQNFKNFNNNIPQNNYQYNYINPNSIQQPHNPNFYQYQNNTNENYNNNNHPYYQDYSAQQKYNDQYNFHQINQYHGEEARNSFSNENISMEEKLRSLTLSKTANDYIPKSRQIDINKDQKLDINGNGRNNIDNTSNFSYKNNSFSSDSVKSQYSGVGLDDVLIANDETDKEIYIPKYQNCECCEGFVYKCKGIACESMDSCYCKFTAEMEMGEFGN